MYKFEIFIVLLFILSSCSVKDYDIRATTTSLADYEGLECYNDSDCDIGGCSSQICGNKNEVKDIITTCEYRQEYECLKSTSCGCINNRCVWEENTKYLSCLKERERDEI